MAPAPPPGSSPRLRTGRSRARSEVVGDYRILVVGAPRPSASDLYHGLLRMRWWALLTTVAAAYLALNALFATLFLVTGGVVNAQPGSFVDAFFFSVQTLGTIGYGAMYPVTRAANTVVVAESVMGLIVTALATGLVFVRFSQTRGRVVFSRRAALGPMDGVPTLMIRVGNERSNLIFDAVLRLALVRTRRTAEGVVVYQTEELALVRERATTLTRSWNMLHRVVPGSPLHGERPETLAAAEAELLVTLSGTDDTSLQPVHAQHRYLHHEVAFGSRLADVLSETPEGDMLLDLRQFHALAATRPTDDFPWPAADAPTA